MTRTRVRFSCTECGAQAPKWLGRCPECGSWSTLEEEVVAGSGGAAAAVERRRPARPARRGGHRRGRAGGRPGIEELDRVLGGGLVGGSVTLLGGEPGIGKSTLLLQALVRMAEAGARALLVTAEESKEQVRLRAERLGAIHPGVLIVAATSLPEVARARRRRQPRRARGRLDPDGRRSRGAGRARIGDARCGSARTGSCGWRRTATCRPCSSATSPRRVRSPARGCSSTSWTPCSRSKATVITRCGCCTR